MTYDGRYPEPPYDKGDDATVTLAVELAERDATIAEMKAALRALVALHNYSHLDKGIGTALPEGKAWLEARRLSSR